MDEAVKMTPQIVDTIKNLRANGFDAQYFPDGAAAVTYLQQQIHDVTVGLGGSLTLQQLGVDKALSECNQVYWHWRPDIVEDCGGMAKALQLASRTEVYISSANAVTQNGELVNIDGSGNRISALAYGPKRVFFVVGVNKLTPDLDRAVWRARNIAAPRNAQRLQRRTPCAAKADRCYDCHSAERICRGMLILARPMLGMQVTVMLLGEELGM